MWANKFNVRIDLRVDNSSAKQEAEQFLDNAQSTYRFQLKIFQPHAREFIYKVNVQS